MMDRIRDKEAEEEMAGLPDLAVPGYFSIYGLHHNTQATTGSRNSY